jgi:epoxyqueuosine reductase
VEPIMNNCQELTNRVLNYAREIGVDIIGFADPTLFTRFPPNNRPENYLQSSQTVVIIGIYLFDITLDAWSEDKHSKRNHHFLDAINENYCYKIKDFLLKEKYDSKIISYAPGLFLKDAAALSGIGPIGKNNLLITDAFGSQVRLRALATTAPLICGEPVLESSYCKNCDKCMTLCPAKAFPNGKYDRDLCYKYATTHLKKLSECTSVWCNVCIEACPVRGAAIT